MGTVYIFRGKAAAGKTTLSNMLAEALNVPVIRKDDIVDALKTTASIDTSLVTNEVCYNILCKIIQTNLDLGIDLILDIALGDKRYAKWFYNRLDFKDSKIVSFFVECSDTAQWKSRHEERLKNPLPHQSFQSFEKVLERYKDADFNAMEREHVIDSSCRADKTFQTVLSIVKAFSSCS